MDSKMDWSKKLASYLYTKVVVCLSMISNSKLPLSIQILTKNKIWKKNIQDWPIDTILREKPKDNLQ